jgi:type IV pilus assembly protein PilW
MRFDPHRQHGLSLVELMVSVAISAAVLSSLVYVYVGSRAAYRNNEALARVQETGRFALEWISRDLREAGFMGCLSRGASISVRSIDPTPALLPTIVGVFGHEEGNGFSNPTGIARVRGDVLLVSSLEPRTITPVNADTNGTSVSIADNGARFVVNDVIVVADCSRAAVVTVTACGVANCNTGSNPDVLTYGNTKNVVPIPVFRAADRAFVARLTPGGGSAITGYFIGNNRAGRPSLYRFRGNQQTEEVAESVEDLDLLFGVDSNGDGAVDSYLTAAAVTAAGQWDRVLSVRVSLLVVSTEATGGAATQVLHFRDADADTVADAQTMPADRRLRQVFTTTVALRNRLD